MRKNIRMPARTSKKRETAVLTSKTAATQHRAQGAWVGRLRLWTQELYLACLADASLPKAEFGSATIRDKIRSYTNFVADPAAPPSLRNHPSRDTSSVSLRAPDYQEATGRFAQRLARSLLLDLAILQDSVLQGMLETRSLHSTGGVESYIAQLRPDLDRFAWARYRMVELSAVRNCITHNEQTWQEEQVNRLAALKSKQYELPMVGGRIQLQLAHLFAYKTAVRTVLTQCEKGPSAGQAGAG
ncbi:hypothetical protein WME94_34450 [Sorangium sp. So ce429]